MTTTPSVGERDEYDFSASSGAAVKMAHRLGQVVNGPGVYPVAIIVKKDGRWQLVVEPGKVEELG